MVNGFHFAHMLQSVGVGRNKKLRQPITIIFIVSYDYRRFRLGGLRRKSTGTKALSVIRTGEIFFRHFFLNDRLNEKIFRSN